MNTLLQERPVTLHGCPRPGCGGTVFKDRNGEKSCINCGWYYNPPIDPDRLTRGLPRRTGIARGKYYGK